MSVVHVENQDITRAALADLMGVEDGRIDGTKYIDTSLFGVAEGQLRKGKVQALVLDLGLNPKWDNTHLPRVLKQLAQGLDIAAQDAENFYAYRLALLAHERQVPCALLSNFPGMLGLDEQRSKTLLAAFHAEKIFPKTDVGVEECADWIRQIL
ncbi:MAG TPA: hypothetical protein VJY33_26785 [Isosphaeraceae bacterium]|nr:hypothetical protein [Isosphaeraceae bacterium]